MSARAVAIGAGVLGAAVALAVVFGPQRGGPPRPPGPAPPAPEPDAGIPGAPAPRADVAGIPGVDAVSRFTFQGYEDVPYELTFTHAFPGRTSWAFGPAGKPEHREQRFRFGDLLYYVRHGQGESIELEGPDRDATLFGMELRLAALLADDDAHWTIGADGVATRPVVADGGQRIGTVQRRGTPGDGRIDVVALDGQGEPREELAVLAWTEHDQPRWPTAMRLFEVREGELQRIWDEEVRSVRTRFELRDEAFLPPDRR